MKDKVIAKGKLFATLKEGNVYWDSSKLKVYIPRAVESIKNLKIEIINDCLISFKNDDGATERFMMHLIFSDFVYYDEYSEKENELVIANNDGYEC